MSSPTTTTPGPTTPRAGRTPVPGGEIAWRVDGVPGARPVVLLHGLAMDSTTWDAEALLLARDHLVVRVDARGHGASSVPVADYASHDDLVAVLDDLGVATATLVGLSLGAMTAVDTALTHPDRVEAMLLVSPGLWPLLLEDPHALACAADQQTAIAAWDASAWVEAALRSAVDGPHRTPAEVEPSVRALLRDLMQNTIVRFASGQGSPVGAGARERLGELTCPVETVVGALDTTDPARDARLLAEAVGAPVHRVEGAAHVVNLEQPAALATILLGFLDRTARPA